MEHGGAAATSPRSGQLHEPKLAPPRLPQQAITRNRVRRLIEATPPGGVCCLVAGPGWGKTRALTEVATHHGGAAWWLSLDEADNDAVRLWSHLAASGPGARTGGESPRLLDPASGVEGVVDHLLETTAGAGGWIVLDDVHLLTAQAVRKSLERLAQRLPHVLRLLVASRTEVGWLVARLRADGLVVDLGESELAFDAREMVALVGAADIPVPAAVTDQLRARTEGWPAGIQLALHAARSSDDPIATLLALRGDRRPLADFLVAEALDRLAPPERQFLLDTSVLDRLCGPLCDAVTGRQDSGHLLETLADRHVLISRLEGGELPWYGCHALFVELLRSRATGEGADRSADLHRRAAAWCLQAGDPGAAIRHFLAAAEPGAASDVLSSCEEDYFRRGRTDTLLTWYAALPEYLDGADRLLRLVWGELLGPDAGVGTPPGLGALRHAARRSDDEHLTGEVALIDAHLAAVAGDAARMGDRARAALDNLVPTNGSTARIAAVYATVLAARSDTWSSHPDRARGRLEAELASSNLDDHTLNLLLGARAHALAVGGDLDRALADAREALAWLRSQEIVGTGSLDAGYAEVAALRRLGHREACATAVAMFRSEAERLPAGRPFVLLTDLEAAHSAVDRGDLDAGSAILDRLDGSVLSCLPLAQRLSRSLQDRLRLALGARAGVTHLTAREREILLLLPTRMPLAGLAESLYVSPNTLKTHLKRIYAKLGANGRDDAVQRAKELRLLQ